MLQSCPDRRLGTLDPNSLNSSVLLQTSDSSPLFEVLAAAHAFLTVLSRQGPKNKDVS